MNNKSTTFFSVSTIIVLLVIIVGDLQLFKLVIFPSRMIMLMPLIGLGIIISILLILNVYGKIDTIKRNFSFPIILILLSALISPFMALAFRNQAYFLSIWISINIFFYLFYFLLHSVKIDIQTLEKIIINIGLFAMVLFFIQQILYPIELFGPDVRMGIDRGTLRVWVPGLTFTVVAYLYYLNRFFKGNNIWDIIIALLAFSTVILQASRQRFAAMALVTIIFFFKSKQVKSRFLIAFLIAIGGVSIFFTFYDVIMEMYSVSQTQVSSDNEDVRIRAARYFLTDFMPNDWAYILGNAVGHQRSSYGMLTFKLAVVDGFYLSDIGIIGDYVRYGALFLLGVIILIVKFIRMKIEPEYEYLRYYIFVLLLTMFTGSGNFGAPNILIILIAYIFDVSRNKIITENS